jgi:polysaccharide export outer membrane protein
MWVRLASSFFALMIVGASAAGQEGPTRPQFAPDQQQSYVLQPGDELEVSVWGDPSASRQAIVAPDGMISYPLIGQIKAAGKTISVLEKEFAKRLSKNYKTPPQVTITLSSIREGTGSQVFITGEVNKPGNYPLTPGMSVMQAITMSGGFGKFAAKSRVQIHRRVGGSEQVLLFDYSDFLSGKGPGSDIVLQPGDVIVVPERGLFF